MIERLAQILKRIRRDYIQVVFDWKCQVYLVKVSISSIPSSSPHSAVILG